ncbi:MAG: universal stress protein [Desulfobulbaceae bacterium]|nr:universal stress protein [Desulfobulbaceae bacterium]
MNSYKTRLLGEIKTILLATDGTEYSEGAVQEAIFFGQACNAKLVVLHVVKILAEMAASMHDVVEILAETVAPTHAQVAKQSKKVSSELERIKTMAENEGIECQVVVVGSYQADKTIVVEAAKHKADVIIMGLHKKKGLSKFFIGSMTSKVIGHGFPKVLVVPKDYIISGESVLLATDGSEFSRLAARETISLAKKCAALKRITIISVARDESQLDWANENVNYASELYNQADVGKELDAVALVGRPEDMIVGQAKEKNVDMIIMGGHGRSGLSKMLMGHISWKVIATAQRSVLVIGKQQQVI